MGYNRVLPAVMPVVATVGPFLTPMHHYRAYSLHIASEIELPELLAVTPNGSADVVVRQGRVPTALVAAHDTPFSRGVLYEATEQQFLLKIDGVARYLVEEGCRITVEPAANSVPGDVRIFMLGSGFGALLHQRGILALHASAIRFKDHVVAFAGHSGAGKSTLLSALLQRGYSMLADDVTGIQLDVANRPMVLPAMPRTKLWADAAAQLEQDTSELSPTRPGLEKFELPVFDQFVAESLPLGRLYVLTTTNDDTFEVEPVEPLHSFAILARHTYRPRYLDAIQVRAAHLRLSTEVARQVKVARVKRPSFPYRLQELVDLLEADFTSPLEA